MAGLLLIVAGLWVLMVGVQGNADPATQFLVQQKAFVSWLVAAAILYALAQIRTIRPAVEAIAALALVAIVVMQWPVITAQWGALTSSSSSSPGILPTLPGLPSLANPGIPGLPGTSTATAG